MKNETHAFITLLYKEIKMKTLEVGQLLKREDLSDWFGITKESFSQTKETKLEELKIFCDYELNLTKKGNFKSVKIVKVFCPEYIKNPLKQKFIDWLDAGGIEEVSYQHSDKVFSYPTIVDYFCYKNDIPYDGPHYLKIYADGISIDGEKERKIYDGVRTISNNEFKEWLYLYRIIKRYAVDIGFKCGSSINCCGKGFNPILLRKETDIDRELQNQIYQKYFGKLSYEDVNELVDKVAALVEAGEISAEDRDRIIEDKLMRTLTNQEKRTLAAKECADLGILRRKGYEYENTQRVTEKEEKIDIIADAAFVF